MKLNQDFIEAVCCLACSGEKNKIDASYSDLMIKSSFFDLINESDGVGFRALQSYFIKSVLLLETAHFDEGNMTQVSQKTPVHHFER